MMNAKNEGAHELQQAIGTILRQYEQAIKTAKKTQKEAHIQRKRRLSDAQQRFSQQRSQADAALKEINASAQKAKQITDRLSIRANNLSVNSTTTFQTNVDATQILQALQNRRVTARRLMDQLRNMADDLEAERKKWWKFW